MGQLVYITQNLLYAERFLCGIVWVDKRYEKAKEATRPTYTGPFRTDK